MNNKKRLIYQVYIGSSKLHEFCIESVSKYCKKYNIDHIVQREQKLCICPDTKTSGRSLAAWNKPGLKPGLIILEKENAFDLLNQYDQIAIIDADVYIRDSAENIFNELSEEYDFGAVAEREMPLTPQYQQKIFRYSKGQYENLTDVDWKWNPKLGAEFFNMGVMILNNSFKKYLKNQSAREFLARKEFKKFIDGVGHYKFSTDQTLLNYFIKKENIKVKHLDWKWNAMYLAVSSEKLIRAQFIHVFNRTNIPHQGENIKDLIISLGLK